MGTVFGKNTTSASITVAGHKVYYIDSTDAEIVEVEGQGGGGSTASDDATGTISGVTLPTAHSYTGVTFDSLRYYVKGTLSNTGSVYGAYGYAGTVYYGTVTWTDETLGDLTDKITVTDPQYNYRAKQTVFRIIFISSDVITGYHPWDDNDNGEGTAQISSYSYNNGVHSITFYATSSWYGLEPEYGCIQFRYLDGTTTFQNLSAFDLVSVSSGTLSKVTSTNRYKMYNAWGGNITLHALYGSAETIRRNAFKYTLSGTPYWYVIDGEHDTWTDDLSAWGYSEVQPVVVLPAVGKTGEATVGAYAISVSNGNGFTTPFSYDSAKIYSVSTGDGSGGVTRYGWTCSNVNNYIYATNTTGDAVTVYGYGVYECNSLFASVVAVYDSSNNAFSAFKFTANNTDYYYVLDDVQTDWTDDLAGIGYSLTQTLEIVLALRYDPSTSQWKTVRFDQTPSDTENYWWGCVINQEDVAALQAFGLTYHDPSSIWSGQKYTGPIGNVVYNSGYSYEVIALYSDMGTTEVAQSLLPNLTLEPLNRDNTDLLTIWSKDVLDWTQVKTWKVRITKL